MGIAVKLPTKRVKEQKMRINRRTAVALFLSAAFILFSFLYISPPLNTPVLRNRSSDLILKTVKEDGQTINRYEDNNGNLTDAADVGYAVRITEDTGNGRTERYYKETGEPAVNSSGYCGIQYRTDAENRDATIIYLGEDGQPVVTAFGYAIVRRTFDEAGRVITEKYYDAQEEPVQTRNFGAGKIIEYTGAGNTQKATWLNLAGQPVVTGTGYATVVRTDAFDETGGKTIIEFFYDENGQPQLMSKGQYGTIREYAAGGKRDRITYLDADGNPVLSKEGFAIKETTLNPNGVTERYFDAAGEPCALAGGQYGTRTDEQGRVFYLDMNGRDQFSLNTLLYNVSRIVIPSALIMMLFSLVLNKNINWMLLILHIGIICYLTLLNRSRNGEELKSLLQSYRSFFTDAEARAEIIKNIWLFIPLGTILYRLCAKRKILLLPVAFSVLIELLQRLFRVGVCELDDVISNSIGGLLGYLAGVSFSEAGWITYLRQKISRSPIQSRENSSRV